jgi:hypothetical protein
MSTEFLAHRRPCQQAQAALAAARAGDKLRTEDKVEAAADKVVNKPAAAARTAGKLATAATEVADTAAVETRVVELRASCGDVVAQGFTRPTA